jgi:hypothetical protein
MSGGIVQLTIKFSGQFKASRFLRSKKSRPFKLRTDFDVSHERSALTFMHKYLKLCITELIGIGKMRTTLDLPEDLLHKAMAVSHIKTKTQVITLALQELIRKSEISDLKKFKGKINLDIDLDVIRNRS